MMQTILSAATILGFLVGLAGLFIAWMTNREKKRLEKLIHKELCGLAGNIKRIRENPDWADIHFGEIQARALKLERNEDVDGILQHTLLGARDATASVRMMDILLNQVLALQEDMFGTKSMTFVDIAGKIQQE